MASRVFAIGDIHGCASALDTLLASLELRDEDRFVFLGDYVDRGPDSRGVIERMIGLSANPNHVFLRGNHEAWMLRARTESDWLRSWWDVGGQETIESYGALTLDEVPQAHWDFIESTQLYFQTFDHIFVHGATGDKPLEQTGDYWLLWRRIYDISPHPSGKRVICGHTRQQSGLVLDRDFAVCIDTNCQDGGWLTALEVRSNAIYQANEWGSARQGDFDTLAIHERPRRI